MKLSQASLRPAVRFEGTIEMAALYRQGVPLARATRPWLVDLSVLKPYDGLEPGNIPEFEALPDPAAWRLGDTPGDDAARLRWHRIDDGGRRLLICDRMILVRVSWDDLDAAGYVRGRDVVIDGRSYRCRLLGGGDAFRVAEDGFAGGAPANEWDRIIGGDGIVDGGPAPTPADLADATGEAVRTGAHNRFWNWFGAVSWTREPYAGRATARCCRGYRSARFFYLNTRSHRHEDIGWRPVLEPL